VAIDAGGPEGVRRVPFTQINAAFPVLLQLPSVNESNFKHYHNSKAITHYHEFLAQAHYTLGQDGWEEVADYALEWATKHTAAL
jgi:hypothetical protein